MKFEELGLTPGILRAVASKGYTTTTPIQAQAIPAILNGNDVLGGAQTGTGKTAAFALPILDILSRQSQPSRHPRALVLTPTRELADQVAESFISYGRNSKLGVTKIYGGVKINPQIASLRNGTDIVIATPGRLLDHLGQKTINLSKVEILVLDEADRMLDMGFIRDIRKILAFLPGKRQNLMFSATYGKEIRTLAQDILNNPVSVEVTKRNTAAEKVRQLVHFTANNQKRHLLAHLIKEDSWYQVLVFVRTKHGANRLAAQLLKEKIPTTAIHGNKSQAARTRALDQFKKGDMQALIATDIAARGIDLQDLSHVVNFDLPNIPEDYVHRIGRTGRAGKSGIAISLVSQEDKKHLQNIEKLLKYTIPVELVPGFKPVVEITAKKENYKADSRQPINPGIKKSSTNGNRHRSGNSYVPNRNGVQRTRQKSA